MGLYLVPHWRFIERSDRIIEIGCGAGDSSLVDFDYLGFDPSATAIARARYRYGQPAKFDVAEGLPPGHEADLIYAISVFQHLSLYGIKKCVEGARLALRPGGALFFNALEGVLPDEGDLDDKAIICEPHHLHKQSDVVAVLNDAGFGRVTVDTMQVAADGYWCLWFTAQ